MVWEYEAWGSRVLFCGCSNTYSPRIPNKTGLRQAAYVLLQCVSRLDDLEARSALVKYFLQRAVVAQVMLSGVACSLFIQALRSVMNQLQLLLQAVLGLRTLQVQKAPQHSSWLILAADSVHLQHHQTATLLLGCGLFDGIHEIMHFCLSFLEVLQSIAKPGSAGKTCISRQPSGTVPTKLAHLSQACLSRDIFVVVKILFPLWLYYMMII